MNIDPKDWVDRAFYLGSYEQHLVHLIAATVRPGDICIDVGAQKGFITLHLAKAVGPGGRVIAFEPDPRAMEALTSNVQRNGFEQVKLFACALGDRDGVCEFVLSRQLGWSSRFPNEVAKAAVASTTSVCTRRLDDVIAETGIVAGTHRISFIKIDAEGSEPLVLQGARETLARFRPTIHIEVNKASLYAGGFSTDSIEFLLRSLDYELYAIGIRRSGWLLRRRLSLIPIASLASDIQGCRDVLAVSSRSRARGPISCLLGRLGVIAEHHPSLLLHSQALGAQPGRLHGVASVVPSSWSPPVGVRMMEPSTTSPAPAAPPKLPPLDYRIPRWAPDDLEPRSCPFCGAQNGQVLRRPDDRPVAYCAICAVWYVASIPRPERLEHFYQGYWDAFRPARLDARTAKFMMRATRGNARTDPRINRLVAVLGTLRGKRVLDLGCGLGGFLLSMQVAGAEPLGVEISREAREFARQYLGLPVYEDLSQCLTLTGPVDAIVLNDVVEHLDAPADLLETAVTALRPGGVLAIWTPNGGAAGTDLASARTWVGFRVDLEHLQYLSTRTILLLAEKLGLTVEHLETTGFPGLAGINQEPKLPTWFRAHLQEARTAVSSSPVGPIARALRNALRPGKAPHERTTGTYHLFAVLKNGCGGPNSRWPDPPLDCRTPS